MKLYLESAPITLSNTLYNVHLRLDYNFKPLSFPDTNLIRNLWILNNIFPFKLYKNTYYLFPKNPVMDLQKKKSILEFLILLFPLKVV